MLVINHLSLRAEWLIPVHQNSKLLLMSLTNTANVCIIIIHMILPMHFFSDNYFINIKDFKTVRILLQVGTTITGKLMNYLLKYFPYANQTGLI